LPPLPPAELVALARTIAQNHALDPALVCAVVEQESSWDAHAIRYEPAFRTRYVAPLGLPPTEEVARSMSWGLMQVMGQVAREHSFSEKFLSALCDPATGLDVGCTVLASKFAAAAAAINRSAGLPGRQAGILPAVSPLPLPPPLPSLLPSQSSPSLSLSSSSSSPPSSLPAFDADLASRALQLWNGGGNPNYASQVLARLANYK
jgi:hypothetical protein